MVIGSPALYVTTAKKQKNKGFLNMLYVSQFEQDATKSFSNVAYHNIKCLQQKSVNFEIRSLENVINWGELPPWLGSSKDYFAKTKSSMDCAVLQLMPPDILKSHWVDQDKTIGYTVTETSLVPQWIAEAYNESLKGLIVPSEYVKKAFVDAGVRIPVQVVQHALGSWWFQDYPKFENNNKHTYVFGNVGYWNSRKNQETLVRAYLKAFPSPREDVALMLKTYKAQGVESLIASLAKQERPDIWVYNESWSEAQMVWGYSLIDCYVSPHKGEGFGLSLANAAALGKPVLYTDYSAPTEWLGKDHHYVIEYDKVKLTQADLKVGYDHLDQSLEWAEPSEDHLVEQLRMLENLRPTRGFRGDELSKFREWVSWDGAGSSLVSAIEQIMGNKLNTL